MASETMSPHSVDRPRVPGPLHREKTQATPLEEEGGEDQVGREMLRLEPDPPAPGSSPGFWGPGSAVYLPAPCAERERERGGASGRGKRARERGPGCASVSGAFQTKLLSKCQPAPAWSICIFHAVLFEAG